MTKITVGAFTLIFLSSFFVVGGETYASDQSDKSKETPTASEKTAKKQGDICVFKDESGIIRKANSKKDVPTRFRSKAECKPEEEFNKLASPDEIEVDGGERSASVSTSLGRIEARLSRGAGKYFARMPNKALIDAAQAVNRGLTKGGFPSELRRTNFPWKVIFLDKDLPETQIPLNLISNCNPAWMTAPANIYVIAQRVAGECNGQGRVQAKGVSDAQLAETLVHEMAHVVEYHLLKGKNPGDKSESQIRAEGFATWFTSFAAGYSTVVEDDVLSKKFKSDAAANIKQSPKEFKFDGTAGDYARASMYFQAVQNKRGTAGINALYDLMANNGLDFFQAIQQVTGWSKQQLEKEIPKATTR